MLSGMSFARLEVSVLRFSAVKSWPTSISIAPAQNIVGQHSRQVSAVVYGSEPLAETGMFRSTRSCKDVLSSEGHIFHKNSL